jgi:hypothetical protein
VTALITLISIVANVYTIQRILRGPSKEDIELRREVYYQVDMACHEWKNAYIYLNPDIIKKSEGKYKHIWETLKNEPAPPYTREAYLRFKPLFELHADLLRKKLDDILKSNSDILPTQFRSLMMKTMMRIEHEQSLYRFTATLIEEAKNKDRLFEIRFHSMVNCIAELSYEADRLQCEE